LTDPDPDQDPDPGGPKTCGSGGSGFGSATLVQRIAQMMFLGVSLAMVEEQAKTITYLKIIVAGRLWTRRYFLM
jgi:hypothetical protein